jgi:molecular chaperone DnaJ
VSYPQVALGAAVDVPGITGTLSLDIPAGTQSGHVFTMRGKGLPRVNASGTGDLHVRVQVWTPSALSREERTLVEQLGAMQQKPPEKREKGFWAKMKEAITG